MSMSTQPFAVRLHASDSVAVQHCFDSQPKVMMDLKKPGRTPYALTFQALLDSGCIAYGVWNGAILQAFSVVWPWPTAPAATLVMGCNRPSVGRYNPQRSGFQATLDACLQHLEQQDRRLVYFVRSSGRAWKNSTAQKGHKHFGKYACTVAERISAGMQSKYVDFNCFILGNQAVSSDAVIIAAVAPMEQDF